MCGYLNRDGRSWRGVVPVGASQRARVSWAYPDILSRAQVVLAGLLHDGCDGHWRHNDPFNCGVQHDHFHAAGFMKSRTKPAPGKTGIGSRLIIGHLTCRAIAEHARDIYQTDLSCPIILSPTGEVLDGWHRICRAYLEGIDGIDAVQLPILPPYLWRVLPTGEEVPILDERDQQP
jgi:hypothetical protein